MKYKAHVPTEQYGFIEVESEDLQDVLDNYHEIKVEFTDKEGWNQNDWAKIRNRYISSNEITPEELEGCSRAQKFVINEVKKSFKSLTQE